MVNYLTATKRRDPQPSGATCLISNAHRVEAIHSKGTLHATDGFRSL